MAVIVRFELFPRKEKHEEIRSFFKNILQGTRDYVGNQGVFLSKEQENGDKLMLVEYWASKADFEKYLNWRVETGDFGRLGELLSKGPDIQFFDVLDDYR